MIRHAPKRRRFNGATRKALARQIRAAALSLGRALATTPADGLCAMFIVADLIAGLPWRVEHWTRAELRASLRSWRGDNADAAWMRRILGFGTEGR